MPLKDKAKHIYAKNIKCLFPSRTIEIASYSRSTEQTIMNRKVIAIGWAVRDHKRRTAFTDKQKTFMLSKFNIGKVTGKKVDPYVAAEEMQLSGSFVRNEFLSGHQISSFFSRMCQNERKTSLEDVLAAEEEDKKDGIKVNFQAVLSS